MRKELEVVLEPIRSESLGVERTGRERGVGDVATRPHQTRAYFTPEQPFTASGVYINYGAGIHDLAGNQMTDAPPSTRTALMSLCNASNTAAMPSSALRPS